jgi:hypothetical protein
MQLPHFRFKMMWWRACGTAHTRTGKYGLRLYGMRQGADRESVAGGEFSVKLDGDTRTLLRLLSPQEPALLASPAFGLSRGRPVKLDGEARSAGST